MRTSHVFAMFRLARSTSEMSVGTREVRKWKSCVNAIMPPVRLRLRRSRLEVPLPMLDNTGQFEAAPVTQLVFAHAVQ
ncbi:MAG TPA: hypothetical protein VI386_20610 [Candidatus Sulfotelmatobacter sp.]